MKKSELKSIIRECIEEIYLDEKAPHRAKKGFNPKFHHRVEGPDDRENTQIKTRADHYSTTSGMKPLRIDIDPNGKLNSDAIDDRIHRSGIVRKLSGKINPKLPKDRK